MKTIRDITIRVTPLDNDGYLVESVTMMKPKQAQPVMTLDSFLGQAQETVSEKYYAKDADEVAMRVRDILIKQNINPIERGN